MIAMSRAERQCAQDPFQTDAEREHCASVPAGASNSIDTGRPRGESDRQNQPGQPGRAAGRDVAGDRVSKGRARPRTSTVVSSPIRGAGTSVVGNAMAAVLVRAK